MYGHYGQGCVHMRINFDFHSEKGLRDFRQFIDRAADLVLSFGGSLSGEHRRRSIARRGTAAQDVRPGTDGGISRIQGAVGSGQPHESRQSGGRGSGLRSWYENLRHGPVGAAATPNGAGAPGLDSETWVTHFAFTKDDGSLERATERCVGVGASPQGERRRHVPQLSRYGRRAAFDARGRARILWEMLAGDLRCEGFRSQAVHEALDLCLSCKACKTECPVSVDMAAYKAEFLAQHYKAKAAPAPALHFRICRQAGALGLPRAGMDQCHPHRAIDEPAHQEDCRRSATTPTSETRTTEFRLRARLHSRRKNSEAKRASQIGSTSVVPENASESTRALTPEAPVPPRVLLWPDTWNNYYHPQTLAAAETVLNEAGFGVVVPQGHICCGRPLYDFGHLDSARAYLAEVLDRMAPHIETGLPFVFLEPSCASVFKDELPELFPDDPRAKKLREQVWLLADWLAAKAPTTS